MSEANDLKIATIIKRKRDPRPNTEMRVLVRCAASSTGFHELNFWFDDEGLMGGRSNCVLEKGVADASDRLGEQTCRTLFGRIMKAVKAATQSGTYGSPAETEKVKAQGFLRIWVPPSAAVMLQHQPVMRTIREHRKAAATELAELDERQPWPERRRRLLMRHAKPLLHKVFGEEVEQVTFEFDTKRNLLALKLFASDFVCLTNNQLGGGWRISDSISLSQKHSSRTKFCHLCGNSALTPAHCRTDKHRQNMRAFLERVLDVLKQPKRYARFNNGRFTT